MRQILIDRARYRQAQKRAGRQHQVTLGTAVQIAEDAGPDLLALDDALTQLAAHNERLARVVEYRFFGGLSVDETATLLDVSTRTVERDWRRAKAYLYRLLNPG